MIIQEQATIIQEQGLAFGLKLGVLNALLFQMCFRDLFEFLEGFVLHLDAPCAVILEPS
jgi:type III secretory pathway component EscS